MSGDPGQRCDRFARRFEVAFLVAFAVIGLVAKGIDYAMHTRSERLIFPVTSMSMFAHPPRLNGRMQERIERVRGGD